MKITPKQYAVLLYELTKDVKKSELKEVVHAFIAQLAHGRALPLLPRILELYNAYYNVREGVVDVEVVSAQEPPQKIKQDLEKLRARAKVGYRIDPAQLGGACIKIGDYMLDDTLKTRLLKLKNKLYGRQN